MRRILPLEKPSLAAVTPGFCAVIGVLTVLFAACGRDEEAAAPPPEMQQQPPTAVSTVTAELGEADVYENYPGRVHGAREVSVLARVQGILEERLYQEGAVVEAGDPLFRIEREPFEIAIKMARAEQATAQATLRQSEREWQRVNRLFEQNAVSERERDSAQSTFELAQAQVQAANARLEQAELDLRYTEVRAPLSGATSLEAEPEGSLVGPGTLLTTIVELDPVHVQFSIPEDDALIQRAARRAAQQGDASEYRHEARLLLADGTEYPEPGEVDFTASSVDSRTGTVSARVVYPNPDGVLVPGQFVRVRMLQQRFTDVVLVPELAIGQGPAGAQVFVVDMASQTADARPVTLGPVLEGRQVVLGGLEGGEQVVVSGQVTLWPGAPVVIAGDEVDAVGVEAASAPGTDAGAGGEG